MTTQPSTRLDDTFASFLIALVLSAVLAVGVDDALAAPAAAPATHAAAPATAHR